MKWGRSSFILFLVFILLGNSIVFSSNNVSPFTISIMTPPSDAYADEILNPDNPFFYLDGPNALGSPDGEYAQIFVGYANGYIQFDMGRYETITNDTGDDFSIICLQGSYIVKVANDVTKAFTTIGSGQNTTSFDLNDVEFSSARYVEVQCTSVESVYLDAIEAIHYENPASETDDPIITPIEDFTTWDNESKVQFTWEIVEAYPWSYSIVINDEIYEEGNWIEQNIDFSYTIESAETLQISLEVEDFFGNTAVDTVIVEIKAAKTSAISIMLSFLALFSVVAILKKYK